LHRGKVVAASHHEKRKKRRSLLSVLYTTRYINELLASPGVSLLFLLARLNNILAVYIER
jgi:hypothetical protein